MRSSTSIKNDYILVSIIIPNYNGAKFLRKLFESLVNQTFKNFEVIFVDNKSTDDSLQLLSKILTNEFFRDLRVKIVSNSKNLGYCKGNNIGLRYANGDYVVFLSNDTYVSRTWLEELIRVMDSHPSIGVCHSRILDARTGEVFFDKLFLDVYGYSLTVKLKEAPLPISYSLFSGSAASMIVRRSLLSIIGGFDQELFYGDYDLIWRLRLLGCKIVLASRSLCYHYGRASTKILFSNDKLEFHNNRELIRVLIKCYSTKNLLKRLPLLIAIMPLKPIYYALKYSNSSYILDIFRALFWNLKNLGNTLNERSKVQSLRKVSDREIESRMMRYPVVLRQLRKYVTHLSTLA